MKKPLLCLFLVMSLLLSGCACLDGTIKVKADGSGTATVFTGFTSEIWNAFYPEDEDYHEVVTHYKGSTMYLGEEETAEFANIEEFNAMFNGNFALTKGDNALTLFVYNVQEKVEDEVSGYVDDDELAALMGSMVMELKFEFPMPVRQIKGDTSGITINRCELTLDLLQMGQKDCVFYIGDVGTFTDVSADAWYFTAVSYMQGMGMVNGYPGGAFGPNDKLTTSALCRILFNVAQPTVAIPHNGYWAYDAIDWCIGAGYIKSHGDITSKNYDTPITREEAVAAITRCYSEIMHVGADSSGVIVPDITLVDDAYKVDILHAYALGIVSGVDSAGTFNPVGLLTRAELCQMFYNLKWTPATVA